MKTKKVLLGLCILSIFLFSILSVSALTSNNITIVVPNATSIMFTSSFTWNVSIQLDAGASENYTRAAIYISSAGLTANTTAVLVDVAANDTVRSFLGTFDTTGFQDGPDYIFNVTLYNGTDFISLTRTSLDINNTIPAAPSSPSPANLGSIIAPGTQTFSQTVIGANTTSCTYTLNRDGQNSGPDSIAASSTHSGNTCSFTKAFSTSADNGNWCWIQTASDGLDSTASSQNCVSVGIPGAGGGLPIGEFVADESTGALSIFGADEDGFFSGTSAVVFWIIVGIIVIIVIVWLIVKK